MSLANLIVQPGRAVLQADAGAYYPDGTVAWLAPKLYQLQLVPAAFTMRGIWDRAAFDAIMSDRPFRDVIDFLSRLPEALRTLDRRSRATDPAAMFCCYVAAYVEQAGRPQGYVVTNSAAWFDGKVQPFTLTPMLSTVGGTRTVSDMLGRPVADLSDPAQFDIDRDSLPLIEAQRATPWACFPEGSDPTAVPAIRIGGWVDQAEVTAAGVAVKRLVTWPDRVGERINVSDQNRQKCQ